MTPEQWRLAKEALDRVLAYPEAERAHHILRACNGDEALCREVESMLAAAATKDDRGLVHEEPGPSASTLKRSPVAARTSADSSAVPWGQFTLLEEIGRGGFGRVYRAWDPALKRDIALKLMDLDTLPPGVDPLVLREGQLLARVQHRNVVTIYSAQQIGSEIGLAMELITGRTLSTVVAQKGPLGVRDVITVGCAVCDALSAVHKVGLVHRDVKASNVMRERGGRIVLMDFGAGRDMTRGPATRSPLVGTPPYMAPELFTEGHATVASDVYAVGILLYYLVTREYPSKSVAVVATADSSHVSQSLRAARPDLPIALVVAIADALAPSPAARPRSALSLKRLLTAAGASSRPRPIVRSLMSDSAELPSGPTTTSAPSPRFSPARILLWSLVIALGSTFLLAATGAMTTTAFNVALARPPGFATETAIGYVNWGRMVLTPAAIFLSGLVLCGEVVRWLCIGVFRLALRHTQLPDRMRALAGWFDTLSPAQILRATSAVGALGVAAIAVSYQWLLLALTNNVDSSPASALALLGTRFENRHAAYRFLLLLLMAALVVGSIQALRRASWSFVSLPVRPLAVSFCAFVVAWGLYTVPWRLLFSDTMAVVTDRGVDCYKTGENGGFVLLTCPGVAPPRNRVVPAGPNTSGRGVGKLFDGFDSER